MKAVEFFSGIGAFSEAAKRFGVEVIAAFDQNGEANATFAYNFGLQPLRCTLDSVNCHQIPDADLWWLSPPCTPYTVRGAGRGLADNRAKSLINLVALATEILPSILLLENVSAFCNSPAERFLQEQLGPCGYQFSSLHLCSTRFGVPMRRPRYYVAAARKAQVLLSSPSAVLTTPLSEFLLDEDPTLLVPVAILTRYGEGFDLVDPDLAGQTLSCFTRNYAKCMKASGSLLQTRCGLRRVSPEEILALLGFSSRFCFPMAITREQRWRLAGNSVDVRAIEHLLSAISSSSIVI